MNNELYHYGVLGMKWGKRRARGHAGPGSYIGSTKRQISKHKKDLDDLNEGKHLSIGLTKKRQEAYDKRDKAAIEKKISKLEERQNKPKSKLSKGAKIAIGSAVTATALAGIGAALASKKVQDAYNKRRITSLLTRAFAENM